MKSEIFFKFDDPVCNKKIERIVLEKIYFEYCAVIPKGMLANITVDQVVNCETKAIEAWFRTFIPGKIVRKEFVKQIVVYDSWWEHFKSTWPLWIRRYILIKSRTESIEINHFHLCPHTGIIFEPDRMNIHWAFIEGVEPDELRSHTAPKEDKGT